VDPRHAYAPQHSWSLLYIVTPALRPVCTTRHAAASHMPGQPASDLQAAGSDVSVAVQVGGQPQQLSRRQHEYIVRDVQVGQSCGCGQCAGKPLRTHKATVKSGGH
jgi:hypothetical protein